MKRLHKFALIALVLAAALEASAAEIAVLRNGFEIRHERHEQLGATTRLYMGAAADAGYVDIPTDEIASFRPDDTPPAPDSHPGAGVPHPSAGFALGWDSADLKQAVEAASALHQIDPDLISSVIQAESGGNPRAVSPKGARGLMQLMPGTATRLGVSDAFRPESNVEAGTRYLRELLLRYDDDMARALAAYNAGPQRVLQYHGVPPYRETHAYVARVIRDFNRKKLAQKSAAAPSSPSPKSSPARKPAPQTRPTSARKIPTPPPQRAETGHAGGPVASQGRGTQAPAASAGAYPQGASY